MSAASSGAPRPAPSEPDASLARAIDEALDGLLHALELEPLGEDRFLAHHEPSRFGDHVYGGQVLAQSLLAASRSVPEATPHSLHAYFVEAGSSAQPIELEVARVRDGRSISTRRVTAFQGDRMLLTLVASFHAGPTTPELSTPSPEAPPPEALPLLQDWIRTLPPETQQAQGVSGWLEHPPPLEIRVEELPSFMGGVSAGGPRAHWFRLRRDVGDDPLLHAALLVYASDFFLMDAAFRSHPDALGAGSLFGLSLDHALWLHRPIRFDRWHCHTQEAQAIAGDRGLARGVLHDDDGHLVASVMQECLIRARR